MAFFQSAVGTLQTLVVERRTEFDVYIINKKTTYNARDGTGQTK